MGLFSDPVRWGHFIVSFAVSGLVALTYSYFAIQYGVLRVLYPRLWFDGLGLRRQARAELCGIAGRLRFFQVLAGLIPLAGAVLMLTFGPEQLTLIPRLLIIGLIALGMAGFGVALFVSSRVMQILTAFK